MKRTEKTHSARHSNAPTRADLDAIKLKKFRELARHANTHSPYYAKIIRERGLDLDTCTPADFPVLTKPALMANFDDIVTERRITKQVVADFLTRSSDPKERLKVAPFAVAATGEMVTKADLQLLSEAFGGAAAFSMYPLPDVGHPGARERAGCPLHGGPHRPGRRGGWHRAGAGRRGLRVFPEALRSQLHR